MKKWLHPHKKIIFACIFLTIISLIYVLGINTDTKILCYVVYAFSTYTLVVSCMAVPRLVRHVNALIRDDQIVWIAKIRHLLEKNEYTKRYLYDAEFRTGISLYTGFCWNLFYALFKMVTGVVYSSLWMFAIGGYYLVLGINRFHMLRSNRGYERITRDIVSLKNTDSAENTDVDALKKEQKIKAYKTYRSTGGLLLFLDATMMGLLIQMIYQNKSNDYPEHIIYVSAIYTFYYFITALISIVKWFKHNNPIMTAAKNVSFAGACMSILSLQTTMITHYGNKDAQFQRLMNSVTGGLILIFIMGMSAVMIWRGNVHLREMDGEKVTGFN